MKTSFSALSSAGVSRLSRQIFLFSLPLMVSNVLQVLFNMADIAVVGQFAGSLSLAAVGSTAIAVTLFTGLLMGIGSGVNSLIARWYGAGDTVQLRRTLHSAFIICFLAGVLLFFVGLFGSRPLLQLLNTKEELLDRATLYMQIYFCATPAIGVYNFGTAVFSAIGNTRKPLVYMLISGVLNVILNLFFVVVCHLDVAGVAIASVISLYLSAILVSISLLRTKEIYGLRIRELRLHKASACDILRLGIPAGLQNAVFYVANMFIQAGVNSFDTTMVAGNSAAANADALVYDVMNAFYIACGSFIGLNYGARNPHQIKRSYWICLTFAFGSGLILGLSLVIFGRPFLALFTTEAAVIEAGMKRLVIMGLSYAVSALMDTAIAASRGIGKSLVPMIACIGGSCVFRIIWVFTIFAWFHTIESLYLLYIFSWTITAIFENWYFWRCYRKISRDMAI
ncbi:MAG: MATE family efflux transporter [Ruminococcaceae bacterium]|nr:MATE family efflux transporter [Oscillospiraceae bacterium]